MNGVIGAYLQDRVFGQCFQIHNGCMELIISLDRGPRVLHCSLSGKDNIFYNDQNLRPYKSAFEVYNNEQHIPCGGHRLLMYSEMAERTYYPDNAPVELKELDGGYLFTAPVEKQTNIQKSLFIAMEKDQPFVQIEHRIKNSGIWEIEVTPWGLTSFKPGGIAYMPMPKAVKGNVPGCALQLWDLCDLSDRTINISRDRIIVISKAEPEKNAKLGFNNEDGYMAYFYKGQLFLKFFEPVPGGFYPHGSCNCICQREREDINLSSLGEATFLLPGDAVDYSEKWEVHEYQTQKLGEEEIEKILKEHL